MTASSPSMNVRAAAAQIVADVMQGDGSLTTLLPRWSGRIAPLDQGLLQELCYGTLRHFYRLDALVKPLLKQSPREADSDIYALLLVGSYQLLHTRIPAHAALHETVEGCRTLNKPWATGLLNAVLRTLQRERASLEAKAGAIDEFVTGHPAWLAHKIRHAWPDQASDIFAANNERPPMTLRVNTQKISRPNYLDKLRACEIAAEAGVLAPSAITLAEAAAVEKLPGFAEGWVSVQDEAAQLCARLLLLSPDQTVLDACCAPGGKTCHILETEPNITRLIAVDNDETRLVRVRENLARQQVSAEVVCADAAKDFVFAGADVFDRILVDAPCSGTGVIRRHPDIRLLRRDTDILPLSETQLAILNNLWPRLAPGGILLYVTCSILPQENERLIGRFIAQHADAHVMPIEEKWGVGVNNGRQLLPAINGTDGFYFSRLTKK